MTFFTASIVITVLLYACVSYMSFFAASTLHRGITYRLAVEVLKSLMFIGLCYISIITDVILFQVGLYETITEKNGFLLLLVAASLINARDGKEIEK